MLGIIGIEGEMAMASREGSGQNGRVAGGTVPEDRSQILLVNKFIIQKMMILQQFPTQSVDKYRKMYRFLFQSLPRIAPDGTHLMNRMKPELLPVN